LPSAVGGVGDDGLEVDDGDVGEPVVAEVVEGEAPVGAEPYWGRLRV